MADTVQEAAASGVAAFASKVTYGGAGGSVLGLMTSNTIISAIGLVVAILGFGVNFYFQRKRDRREEAAQEALMDRIARGERL